MKETFANLLEYAGLGSRSYYHASTPPSYDPAEPVAYYVDESARAHYQGTFDKNGLPLYPYGGSDIYLPVFLCFYGLGQLEVFRQDRREESLAKFVKVAEWLMANRGKEGAWLTTTPMKKFGLIKPFPSAMVQGLAISCLRRAYLLTDDSRFMDTAEAALAPFHKDAREGGVTSYHGERVFYEEYPSYPYHHVLNGFIYALWGLYDLTRAGSAEAGALYEGGLVTLREWLPRFDMGYWSLYHISDGMKNPTTVHYHRLHVDQLAVMSALTGDVTIETYHARWKGYLMRRLNALRTLPGKILWKQFYRPRTA